MKPLFTCLSVVFAVVVNAFADITVSDVKVFSGYPWKEVVIGYTIKGTSGSIRGLSVRAKDNKANKTYDAVSVSGVDLSEGRHVLRWDAYADNARFTSDNVVFTVEITDAIYCIVDLSGGKNASKYPVYYIGDIPSGKWTDEYKTTRLALRLIPKGSFKMDGTYNVTLSKNYYMGVFEVTQKQYELVTGYNPSYLKGDKRPVDNMGYNDIRGAVNGSEWPQSSNVDSWTFIGLLRQRTGIGFDLPTEAQWEYACRAGTTSDYNNGGSTETDLSKVGRWEGNSIFGAGGYGMNEHTTVGSYLPNAWGLYDMHGNVQEMCLDWQGPMKSGTDPKGATSGEYRIVSGGSFYGSAISCSSSWRLLGMLNLAKWPASDCARFGFRICGLAQ